VGTPPIAVVAEAMSIESSILASFGGRAEAEDDGERAIGTALSGRAVAEQQWSREQR
jgi:hypothetical protein